MDQGTGPAIPTDDARYRLLVDAVTDYAIYMLDPGGIITSWNSGAERFKGYREAEILGQHFSRFYAEEDRLAGLPGRALETAARVGRFDAEGWRVRKDATRFWAHVIIDAIRNDQGELLGFAKITRDITEKRDAQRALEDARGALLQAQKMEAVGQLTGGIAHDFNNLLTAILGSLELLRGRLPEDPRLTGLLDNAMQGARRGASLIQRMLAFARRQDLRLEPVDLSALVGGMMQLIQRSVGPGCVVENRVPPALPPVQADANQLELALLNLLVNARDAMPAGGTVVIAAREEDGGGEAPGCGVCLSVADTGEGMDAATLARATEPFFTTKGVGRGTGLGLSMVHGLVQQLGGRLVLRSRPGEGTVAELHLPLAPPGAEVASGAAPAEAGRGGTATQPLVVLAVDDDVLVLTNTVARLEELGHTALQASSAAQALELLRREAVDLVITDHAMPHTTGVQLARAVRAEWPGLPVILATGYAELSPGADDGLARLAKPFGQVQLARVIAEAVPAR